MDLINQKKLKHVIHQHQAKKRQQRLKKHHEELDAKIRSGELKNDPYSKGVELAININEIKDPVTVHNYRRTVLHAVTSSKRSKSRTRNILSEFSTIQFSGVVADVTQDENGLTKILIDHPLIERGAFTGQTYMQDVSRPLDSHIWLQASEIALKSQYYKGEPTITVADTIRLIASVKTYRGKVRGIRTTRYGIDHAMILDCGIPVIRSNKRKAPSIQSLFNRHHDWSLKYPDLKTPEEIKDLPADKDNNVLVESKFRYQESKWPHYQERMKQVKETD